MMPTTIHESQSEEGTASNPHLFCGGEISENPDGTKLAHAGCREMAEFLQWFSNPVRVEILCVLRDGEKSAGEITRRVGAKKSNISQQLSVLTAKGYVVKRRDERNIYYRLQGPEMCEVMEHILHLVCWSGLTDQD